MDPEIPKQEKDSTSSHCMYKKDMDQNHMTSVAVMNRNTTAPVSLYMGNDITAEAVISELNLFSKCLIKCKIRTCTVPRLKKTCN